MLLQDLLKKDNNNIDIFRVIAATLVIYGHSYALLPNVEYNDIIQKFLLFDYSGSIAVKIFFFLSGLVVTNSLLAKKDAIDFIIARFFRIFPALLVVLILMAFIIGPILSTLSASDYFSYTMPFYYVSYGFIMDIQYHLPGVFNENRIHVINGSLWTIPFEVFCYLFLFSLFLIGVMKNRLLMTLFFTLIIVDQLSGSSILFTWIPQKPDVTLLAPCFAFGAILAAWKDKVKIDLKLTLGLILISILMFQSTYNYYYFYIAVFISTLYISGNKLVLKLKPRFDISYGIYLWGWPVQQIIISLYPEQSAEFNQITSIAICFVISYASWKLVERPSINFGRKLIDVLSPVHKEKNI